MSYIDDLMQNLGNCAQDANAARAKLGAARRASEKAERELLAAAIALVVDQPATLGMLSVNKRAMRDILVGYHDGRYLPDECDPSDLAKAESDWID